MNQKEIDLIRLQAKRNELVMFLRDKHNLTPDKTRIKVKEYNKQISKLRKELRKEMDV